MPRDFVERLHAYFTGVAHVLRGEADVAAVFANPTDIGESRESAYAGMLRSHLPKVCNVELGGFLFDQEGNESGQMDIIVTNHVSLRFDFPGRLGKRKSFACVDGCLAVISVKSKLDSKELVNALENLATIPDPQPLTTSTKSPTIEIEAYEEWPFKVLYATDGIALPSLLDSLNRFYASNPHIPPHKRPNIIHVSSKYVVARAHLEGQALTDGPPVPPNTFEAMPGADDVFGLAYVLSNIQDNLNASQHFMISYADIFNRLTD